MEGENSLSISIEKLKNFLLKQSGDTVYRGLTFQLMKKSSTSRKDFFNKHTFQLRQSELNTIEENSLIQNKVISYIDAGRTNFTLTMKGIILLEYDLEINDAKNNNFLNELNKYYYEGLIGKSGSPLECQEKGVIIALLGLLAFSPQSAVKLSAYNDDYSNTAAFRNCVDMGLNFITFLGEAYKDQTKDKIWKLDVRGEDPVAARMARMNSIGLKTDNIYKKSGGHYLDVLNNGQLDTEKIEFLLRKIFDQGPLDYDKRNEFIDLLQRIYSDRYKIIKNIPNFNLLEVKYSISRCVLTYVQ